MVDKQLYIIYNKVIKRWIKNILKKFYFMVDVLYKVTYNINVANNKNKLGEW